MPPGTTTFSMCKNLSSRDDRIFMYEPNQKPKKPQKTTTTRSAASVVPSRPAHSQSPGSFHMDDAPFDESFMDESFQKATPGKPSHQVKFAKRLSGLHSTVAQQQEGGRIEKKPLQRKGKMREGLLCLPPTMTAKLFSAYSTTKITKEGVESLLEAYVLLKFNLLLCPISILPQLSNIRSHEYFKQVAGDLGAYSTHAKRQGIEVDDVACLFRRQRATGPTKPIEDLIRRFLPLEYVEEIIQVARANNILDPVKSRQ